MDEKWTLKNEMIHELSCWPMLAMIMLANVDNDDDNDDDN
jgi:hypothetical protein